MDLVILCIGIILFVGILVWSLTLSSNVAKVASTNEELVKELRFITIQLRTIREAQNVRK